jgi:hypothetical protein
MEAICSPKRWITKDQHGATSQKTAFFNLKLLENTSAEAAATAEAQDPVLNRNHPSSKPHLKSRNTQFEPKLKQVIFTETTSVFPSECRYLLPSVRNPHSSDIDKASINNETGLHRERQDARSRTPVRLNKILH